MFKRRWVKVTATIVLSIAVILLLIWLLPMRAGSWGKQEPSAGYTGAFLKNGILDNLSYMDLGGYTHPETVLVHNGRVYASVKGGVLLRMNQDGGELTMLLDTGGCLLGFDFDGAGNIIVADCDYNGTGALLRVADDGTGNHDVLVSKGTGCELFYPNAIAIASDGTIYLTDSSRAFPPTAYGGSSSEAAANEALMHTCTGRVLAYDSATASVSTLADGLAFSNGIVLSADEKSLFICETYGYSIDRLALDGAGGIEPFISNLPGFPDNMTKGLDGRYWVGLNGERSNSLDEISDKPFLRKIAWLIGKLSPSGESAVGGYCHVFAFTEDGVVTESLQSGSNGYYRSTGATETPDRLYIQSINDSGRLAFIARGE